MIRLKGSGAVLGIILVSASGLAALITFVLAPNIWVGGALALGGGMVIGLAVAFLIWQWWFKGIGGKERR